jgi:hypothetical protein
VEEVGVKVILVEVDGYQVDQVCMEMLVELVMEEVDQELWVAEV